MIKTLHDTVDRYLRLHVSLLHFKDRGQAEHWDLLAACRRGDVDLAVTLLEQHIEGVAVLLAEYLTSDGEESGSSVPVDEAAAHADGASPAPDPSATRARGRRTTRTPFLVRADG
jgi:hypothetical protein